LSRRERFFLAGKRIVKRKRSRHGEAV
jgi:hypothetical protein